MGNSYTALGQRQQRVTSTDLESHLRGGHREAHPQLVLAVGLQVPLSPPGGTAGLTSFCPKPQVPPLRLPLGQAGTNAHGGLNRLQHTRE